VGGGAVHDFDPALGPVLDAAVAAVQAQAQPAGALEAAPQADLVFAADAGMARIGGDVPVARHARELDPVVGLRDHLAVHRHLDPLDAHAVLEGPATGTEGPPHAGIGLGRVDPGHGRERAVRIRTGSGVPDR